MQNIRTRSDQNTKQLKYRCLSYKKYIVNIIMTKCYQSGAKGFRNRFISPRMQRIAQYIELKSSTRPSRNVVYKRMTHTTLIFLIKAFDF